VTSGAGAAASAGTAPDVTAIGVVELSTGTTSTGYCGLRSANTALALGAGTWTWEARIHIPTLSTSGERYSMLAGWHDNIGGIATDAVLINYDEATTTNWRWLARSNGSLTVTTSSLAVTTGWHLLRIDVTATGAVTYTVDGSVLVAGHTTNVPTAAGRETAIVPALITKSAGTTARTIQVDYCQVTCRMATRR
jgi:hypothetical protein